jgi:hypothetical protein
MVGNEDRESARFGISPLLANIYLHYAFDLWVDVWRKKWAQGDIIYALHAFKTAWQHSDAA